MFEHGTFLAQHPRAEPFGNDHFEGLQLEGCVKLLVVCMLFLEDSAPFRPSGRRIQQKLVLCNSVSGKSCFFFFQWVWTGNTEQQKVDPVEKNEVLKEEPIFYGKKIRALYGYVWFKCFFDLNTGFGWMKPIFFVKNRRFLGNCFKNRFFLKEKRRILGLWSVWGNQNKCFEKT